jgi:predicted protein tyrosine phosphatase
MFIDFLCRHLIVCSAGELSGVTRRDPGFWHAISIMEPSRQPVPTAGLRDVLSLRFDDTQTLDTDDAGLAHPRAEHIEEAFAFADERWGEPLLIQCLMGQSRSAALALGMIARGLFLDEVDPFTEAAVDLLLQIRPQANPNVLVLRLALETFLPAGEAEAATREMVNHPVLLDNRFKRW